MSNRYRMYPTPDQAEGMRRHCADARFVWNTALAQINEYRPWMGRRVSFLDQRRQLAEARRSTWLGDGSSSVQNEAIRDLEKSFKKWWGNPSHFNRPTWRRKGVNEGFCVRDLYLKVVSAKWATVFVPKIGPVRFRLSRPLPEKLGMGRVKMDSRGRWYFSPYSPQPAVERDDSGSVIGLDMGIVRTVTASDGRHWNGPVPTAAECARRSRLQRKMARQHQGSRRRERTRVRLARITATEADRRRDFAEKLSTDLVRHNDVIVVEDLRIVNMTRSARGTVERPGVNVTAKRGLNRAISQQGWGLLRRRIEEKAAASNVCVIRIDPRNTSRRCSACGHTTPENRESQAAFRCRGCGHEDNADVNAACNIRAAGLAVIARGEAVSPGAAGRLDETRTTLTAGGAGRKPVQMRQGKSKASRKPPTPQYALKGQEI